MYSVDGKKGIHPVDELYSALKYCGPNALSFPFPPNDELNLATELNEIVSPAAIDDVTI